MLGPPLLQLPGRTLLVSCRYVLWNPERRTALPCPPRPAAPTASAPPTLPHPGGQAPGAAHGGGQHPGYVRMATCMHCCCAWRLACTDASSHHAAAKQACCSARPPACVHHLASWVQESSMAQPSCPRSPPDFLASTRP